MKNDIPIKKLRPFVFAAAISACIQSCVLIGVTIFGIVTYCTCSKTGEVDTSGQKLSNTFGQTMRAMYFLDEKCTESLKLSSELNYLSPYQLLVWEGIVLGYSSLWIIFSVALVSTLDVKKPEKCLPALHIWIYYTIGICIVDVAIGTLFGLDLQNISEALDKITDIDDPMVLAAVTLMIIMKSVSGILMTVALKGYLLWILNMTFAIYFLFCVFKIYKGDYKKEPTIVVQTRPAINAYEPTREAKLSQWTAEAMNMERPHLISPASRKSDYYKSYPYYGDTNPAFAASNENLAFQRSSESPQKNISAIPPWQRSALKADQKEPSPDYSPPIFRRNQMRH